MVRVTDPDEDARWREIVDNYGERVELPHEDPAGSPEPQPDHSALPVVDEPVESERFVPPPPPPVPRPEPPRMAAWAGVLGAPLLLVVAVVLQVRVPVLVSYLLVAWFVGGFAFLVTAMPREPRDPGDDGARL